MKKLIVKNSKAIVKIYQSSIDQGIQGSTRSVDVWEIGKEKKLWFLQNWKAIWNEKIVPVNPF